MFWAFIHFLSKNPITILHIIMLEYNIKIQVDIRQMILI